MSSRVELRDQWILRGHYQIGKAEPSIEKRAGLLIYPQDYSGLAQTSFANALTRPKDKILKTSNARLTRKTSVDLLAIFCQRFAVERWWFPGILKIFTLINLLGIRLRKTLEIPVVDRDEITGV